MTQPPQWMRSPYDQQAHIIRREIGMISEALCEHSAPTTLMEDATGADPRCLPCIMVLGKEMADRRGDPGNYVT